MKTSSLDELRRRLRRMSLGEHRVLSSRSGVPLSTVRKVAYGITSNPRWQTVERLRAAHV